MGTDVVRVRVLGPVVVEGGSDEEALGPRVRRLLVRLVLADGAISDGQLIDAVWSGSDELPADPTRSLRTYVSRLRNGIGADAVPRLADGYRLDRDRLWLDVDAFDRYLNDAGDARRQADDRTAITLIEQALALWTGPVLDGLGGEHWAAAEAHRLEELRVDAREQRADLLLGLGDVDGSLVAELEGLAVEYPHREQPTRLLMLAHHDVGRQADALAAFTRHRQALRTDLGLDPSEELRHLEEQILAGDRAVTQRRSRPLRGYDILERLGEGAFSIVYRGSQQSVGREVAIKQIRAELANRPEFIRRFETEAHLVARLEHPHIVPLFDYWREPDSAYLVMRLLRAGNIEASLRSGPWGVDRAIQMVTQIGGALATAHRSGVVHRDVKPANILLDEDGNAYLTDFGIALEAAETADPSAALSAGSPVYAAPEQLRREPVGPSADVHGLAITTYEVLTAQVPFPDEPTHAALLQRQLHDPIPRILDARGDVPAKVDSVMARATAKDPDERYQTIEEFVAALQDAAGTKATERTDSVRVGIGTAVSGEERNPYKGLRAFDEADATDFSGRDRLVDQLIESVESHRLVAVVGPSGSGKSSVVRAGLLPALRDGAIVDSTAWFITTLLPGANPFEELEAALLRVAAARPADLLGVLTDGPRGIARAIRHVAPDEGAQVLLVIDQFEELFTQAGAEEARRFLDALAVAVTEERSRLRVLLTLRADFYDHPLRHGQIGRLVKEATVAVLPLAPDELEQAIVDPANAVGAEFEPGLVAEIAADVADQPGALPLLQYALTELWERRISGLMTRDAYRELGGVAGSLALRAEELHNEASADEQLTLRRMFGRLVSLGEGVEDTRRRALRSELTASTGADVLIDRFGHARLLSFDTDPTTREPTVEVAHEALLQRWPRVRDWLEEDRDGLRLHRHLGAAASEWDRSGRPAAELYRGGRLEAAEAYTDERQDDLTPVEVEFVSASATLRQEEEAIERERFDQQLRSNRRLRGLLLGAAALLVVALIASGLAVVQRGRATDEAARATTEAERAEQEATRAESEATNARVEAERADNAAATAETRRLVADASAIVSENRDIALLLASEAYRRDPGPQTLAGLQRVLTGTGNYLGQIGHGENFVAGGYLDNGTIVGVVDDAVHYYDPTSWALGATVALPDSVAIGITSGASARIVGNAVVVGTVNGSVVFVDGGEIEVLPVADQPINVVAWSPSLKLVAASDISGVIHLVDTEAGQVLWSVDPMPEESYRDALGEQRLQALGDFGRALSQFDEIVFRSGNAHLDFDDDGTLVVAVGTFLRRLDLADGSTTAELLLQHSPTPDLAPPWPRPAKRFKWSADRSELIVLAGIASVAVVDAALAEAEWSEAATGRVANASTRSVTFDSSGVPWFGLNTGMLASGTTKRQTDADLAVVGLASLADTSTGPDGRSVLAVGDGGMVLWAVDGGQLLARAAPRGGNTEAWISADGEQLIASNLLGGVESRIYDLSKPQLEERIVKGSPMTNEFYDGEDPLNEWFVSYADGRAMHIDRQTLQPNGFEVEGSVGSDVSPDGAYLAIAGDASRPLFRVFDVNTNEQISPDIEMSPWATDEDIGLSAIAFDPTGTRLLISLDSGTTVEFDTATWEVQQVIDSEDSGGARAAKFSRDGTLLVTRGTDGTIAIRNPLSLEVIRTIEGGTSTGEELANGPYISPDGQYLLTVRETKPRLWHLPTGTVIGTFPNEAGLVASGTDEGDELRLVSLLGEHVLVWDLDVERWPEVACRAAGRNMTEAEWEQFGPTDQPYRTTCPQWPAAT